MFLFCFFICSDIPPPDLLKDGVTLSLILYDHDRLTDDDISGLVYYDLKTVPGLKTETVQGGFATVPQIQIPFMIPTLDSEPIQGKELRFFFFYEKLEF